MSWLKVSWIVILIYWFLDLSMFSVNPSLMFRIYTPCHERMIIIRASILTVANVSSQIFSHYSSIPTNRRYVYSNVQESIANTLHRHVDYIV